jgi:hypothetical protein
VKNDRATDKVIGRIGELFLEFKKMFCCFFLIFSILNLPSVFLCRVLFDTRQSLCRVSEKKYLAKNPLPMKYLPSVTLGKGFAECKIAFAECLRHSAKNTIPVVHHRARSRATAVVARAVANESMWSVKN